MKQLTFHELQGYLALKYKEIALHLLFMKLVEEIGEIKKQHCTAGFTAKSLGKTVPDKSI
jgi:membrane-bound acyltransferase YfiQ involved in biofilm formation